MGSCSGEVCFVQTLSKFQLIGHLCGCDCLRFINSVTSVHWKEVAYARIRSIYKSTEIWFPVVFQWSGFTDDCESCLVFVFKDDYQET